MRVSYTHCDCLAGKYLEILMSGICSAGKSVSGYKFEDYLARYTDMSHLDYPLKRN